MSDTTNVEVEVEVKNNSTEEIAEVMDDYTAQQAKEYKDAAEAAKDAAVTGQHMAEAWAESSEAPAGEGTRSAKTWSDVARQWAESDKEPDGVEGARSSKTWNSVAREWAESAAAPDNVEGAKSSKTWAEESKDSANTSALMASGAAVSANNASLSETAAQASAETANTKAGEASASAGNAKASADKAEGAYQKLVTEDLTKKADIAGATFTGAVHVPTPADGSDDDQAATTAFVQAVIKALVNGSPAALDTLKELSEALGNDPNFATTITNLIAEKLDKTGTAVKATADANGKNIASTYATKAEVQAVSGNVSSLAKVAASGSYTDLSDKPTIPTKTSQLTNDSRFVSTDTSGNLTIAGNITGNRLYNAVYSDYAEFFERGGETEPGDLIALDEGNVRERYVKATEKSAFMVGVESDEFAQAIGGDPVEGENMLEANIKRYIPVALMGRVHVRFMGPAVSGGWVVPSEIPGVGRLATEEDDLSRAVGRILKADEAQNVRRIRMLVIRR